MNIWRIFYSLRLALWLILLLAIVSLSGALLQQVPLEIAADFSLKADWLEQVARPTYGGMTEIYNFFGLFDVFHSPIFILLGSLLIINIAACSLKRWPALVKTSRGVDLKNVPRLLSKDSAISKESKLSATDGAVAAADFFSRKRYRVRRADNTDSVSLVADKNRHAPWGTYAIHLSLILLTAGYLIGGYFGFSNQGFVVVENETRAVGEGYDVAVRLLSFEDEYWPDGLPKDYRSQVELISDGQVVEEGLVRVNHPINYNGLKIYQASFGPAIVMHVHDNDNLEVFHGSLVMPYTFTEQGATLSYGIIPLLENNLYAMIITANDSSVPNDNVMLWFYDASTAEFIGSIDTVTGNTVEFQGLNFHLESLVQFAVFQLKEDPGLPLIWASFFLFMVGLGMVFYLPYRQFIIIIRPEDAGSRIVYITKGGKGQIKEEIQSFNQAIGSSEHNQD